MKCLYRVERLNAVPIKVSQAGGFVESADQCLQVGADDTAQPLGAVVYFAPQKLGWQAVSAIRILYQVALAFERQQNPEERRLGKPDSLANILQVQVGRFRGETLEDIERPRDGW